MNSAVKIFDEGHVLIEEISQVKNVKKSIMNILDDVMVNVDNVGAEIDILGEKNQQTAY